MLFETQERRCALTNVELVMTRDRKQNSASLDRIDSTKGYVKGNLQWVHRDVNRMKSDFPQEDFLEWCRKVALANPRGTE